MGVIKRGILGGFSGRVAGVVGSSWKGIAYMKALPLSVANPKTAAQTTQRNKFSYTVDIAKQINSGFIKPMWDRFAVQKSGYNDFVGTNTPLTDLAGTIPGADFIASKGKIASTAIVSANYETASSDLEIEWADDSGQGLKLATDELYAFAIDESGVAQALDVGGAVRSDTVVTPKFSAGAALKTAVKVFIGFRRPDGTIVSDSSSFSATIDA